MLGFPLRDLARGCARDIQNGKISPGSKIVCTLTGHCLKDPDIAIKQSKATVATVEATLEAVKKAIMGNMAE